MSMKRIRASLTYLAYLGVVTLLVLVLLELLLRVGFGRPDGRFRIRPLDGKSLYLPDSTIRLYAGPIPYVIKTNSLGFRGPEFTIGKPAGVTRIVALGDSVTDGFYVDNPDTYPMQLEEILRASGNTVEVINASRGASSIDREIAIFETFCARLDPDIVLLTFVTNDIDELRGIAREDLLHHDLSLKEPGAESGALLAATTAIGELLLDQSLKSRYKNYRSFEENHPSGDQRYAIEGNHDIAANLQVFHDRHTQRSDSILLYDDFNNAQLECISNYLYALEHFRDACRARGIALGVMYTPGYNQIYDPDASLLLRDLIADGCRKADIPFHDLTPRFQVEGKERAIDLAPLDFHPNPHGNRVIAEEAAAFLSERFLGAADADATP